MAEHTAEQVGYSISRLCDKVDSLRDANATLRVALEVIAGRAHRAATGGCLAEPVTLTALKREMRGIRDEAEAAVAKAHKEE